MLNLILTLMAIVASTIGAMGQNRENELKVVESVDLSKYVGIWYEIARLPNRFEKRCADSVTATYALRQDGKLDVLNKCRKSSGEYTTAKGKAKIVDKETNARLKVTFFWPFYGNYWILDLGPNYEYAVVGDPSRKYLWILSRTPTLDEDVYQMLVDKMSKQGFRTDLMIRTLQTAPEARGSDDQESRSQ